MACVPRRLDSDNLAGALKPIRDAISQRLGVDDGDEDRVQWEYGQTETRGPAGVLVRINVE